MALQFSYAAPTTTNYPNAYAKVISGAWTAQTGQITADVNIYADQTARNDLAEPVRSMSVSFPIDLNATQNVVTQAYDAIKARPEFAGAVDV